VLVPVRELDCGKQGMNRDMYEALKADANPNIHYQLTGIGSDLSPSASLPDTSGWVSISTRGELTIAGSTRTVEMKVNGRRMGEQKVRVKGQKRLNMKNFGVEPPTALFGLVQAEDSLTVYYDLITEPVDTLNRQELQEKLGS
jgi:hypothetical protein